MAHNTLCLFTGLGGGPRNHLRGLLDFITQGERSSTSHASEQTGPCNLSSICRLHDEPSLEQSNTLCT